MNTMLVMTDMPMTQSAAPVAPYARPRSSWLRAVSPMATGLELVASLPAFTGVETDDHKGIETNTKAHGARRPKETPT